MTLYETLALHFIEDIKSEKLPVGSRLPALRQMAKQHQVSLTTATKTYDYLQQAGWIFAQPQSGYFVRNRLSPDHIPATPTFKIETRDPKQYAPPLGYNPRKEAFNPLGTSMVSPSLQPSVALQRCIKRVTARSEIHLFQYPETQGSSTLRNALSEHFRSTHFAFKPDDMVITNGCLDAVRLAVETVTKEGDTIAISSPCFSGLLDLLVALSRKIVEIRYDQNGLDLEQLEACLKDNKVQASLLSTSHMNPTGLSLSQGQKQTLAELAEKYNTPMIEDDVYFELGYHDQPLPAKYWDKSGYVLWCGSFSKTLAAGLRIGWCLPGRYVTDYAKRQALTNFGVNSLVQASLAEFIYTGEYRSQLHKLRRAISQQIHLYRTFLKANLPEETLISQPEGGLVLWIKVPNLNAIELEDTLAQEHIDILSGARFSTHAFYHDCFRINCGWSFETGDRSEQVYQQLESLCKRVNALS